MKHVKPFDQFINENVLNEAHRVGRSSWKDILDDLEDMGWDIRGDDAAKSYANDDDDERELVITSRYGSDEVEYKVTDENGNEVDSGSFDAEGLSAGELDGEVWSHIEESVTNEGKVQYKRKYTERFPAEAVSSYAPIREKILSFVKEKGSVTHEELMEFISSMNEESGGSTSRKWVNKNTQYFKITEKNGTKSYRLSSRGERVHAATLKQAS